MRLDFYETNILVHTLSGLEKNPKATAAKMKMKIIEDLYALFAHTDKEYTLLKVAVKSLIDKLEKLSDDEIMLIVEDNRNNNIIASVYYEVPAKPHS